MVFFVGHRGFFSLLFLLFYIFQFSAINTYTFYTQLKGKLVLKEYMAFFCSEEWRGNTCSSRGHGAITRTK